MRTTLDLDKPILSDLRKMARKRRRSMGRVASDLLAEAFKSCEKSSSRVDFHWYGKPMKAKVDLMDREALYDAMDKAGDVR